MSTFSPGQGGTLRSTNKPSALFELAQIVVGAELAANAAEPFISLRKVAMSINFASGLIDINATLPMLSTLKANGAIQVTIVDALGSPYSGFNGGSATLSSTHLFAAIVELALGMVASDHAQEVGDRSNRVQVFASFENGVVELVAALPFTATVTAQGETVISAVDYLYEPPPPPPPPPRASTTPYTASQSSTAGGSPATYALLTDGLYNLAVITDDGSDEWIKATFPSPVVVNSVSVGGGTVDVGGFLYLNRYAIEYSTDGLSWTNLTTISGNYSGFAGGPSVFSYALPSPVTARYWRVHNTDTLKITEFSFT